jgi:RecA-family ATPase
MLHNPYLEDGQLIAERAPRITATRFLIRDPATLPLRDVLYGNHLIRGFTSGLVGNPGSGKSTLALTESFAMVTGKPLLGVEVRVPLRCWYFNLEDPWDELERRAQAVCLRYSLWSSPEH